MKLAKLQGTEKQIEQAEKRRAHYLSLWEKHLSKVKESGKATREHIELIESAIKYISQIESARHWCKIPTGNVMHPRVEMVEVDMRLYDFSIGCQVAWLKMHGKEPKSLAM
jgi:hypothetical protein